MMQKRIFDFCLSFYGLTLLSCFLLILFVIMKIFDPGPVFFIQKRVGKKGKLFKCIKFRTMSFGSEKDGYITTANDRRITKTGSLLRKYKIDELPQLWNVLVGDMSMVGPRPDVPGYADKLNGEDRKLLDLYPGITGPASIYFRNEEKIFLRVKNPKMYNDFIIYPKKVELNLQYIKHWSLSKDIIYIIATLIPSLASRLGLKKWTEDLSSYENYS
jgi:lipopolysaccharide/colanic/teichoic acid biosynthesis glycosyltransferase